MTLDDKAQTTDPATSPKQLPNESAKTHRFSSLMSELFPSSAAPTEFAAGVEKLVRIDTAGGGSNRGFVDAYHGNAIIEFENSLKATEAHALEQLREYTSALWNREGRSRRQFVCVLSDALTGRLITRRQGHQGQTFPEDVELQELRVLTPIEQQDIQALHRARQRMVNHRTAVVSQIRGLLLDRGFTALSLYPRSFSP
jgi:hypothetical protein